MRFGLIVGLSFFALNCIAEIGVSVGAKAGVNLAHIRKIENPSGYDNKILLGSNFGGIASVNFNKFISVQTELIFAQKGQRWTTETDSTKNYIRFNNNYIDFPLLAVARIGSDKVKGILQIGTYFAYWSGASLQQATQQDKVTIERIETDYEFTQQDNRFDLGIASGVGIGLKAGDGFFEVIARHQLGLLNRTNQIGEKQYNCSFAISIAYLFSIKKHE